MPVGEHCSGIGKLSHGGWRRPGTEPPVIKQRIPGRVAIQDPSSRALVRLEFPPGIEARGPDPVLASRRQPEEVGGRSHVGLMQFELGERHHGRRASPCWCGPAVWPALLLVTMTAEVCRRTAVGAEVCTGVTLPVWLAISVLLPSVTVR
jgi:hypothetical protein